MASGELVAHWAEVRTCKYAGFNAAQDICNNQVPLLHV